MGLVAFSIGSVPLYLYGLLLAVSILFGLLLLRGITWLCHEAFAPAFDLVLWSLPVGLLCSRLGYVLSHFSFYADQPAAVFFFWQGGFSLYGAAAGFLLTAFVYCRVQRLSFWQWLDIFIPVIVLGLAMNQFAHFFLQMTVGMPLPLDLPNDNRIAEYIEYGYRPSGFEHYEYFQPVAFYQALAQLGIFFVVSLLSLLRVRGKMQWAQGTLFLMGVLLLALVRFACGFFYLSAVPGPALHFGQVLSLLLAIVCAGGFIWRQRHNRMKGRFGL